MTKPTNPSRGRGPRAIAIIALVFAPLALAISCSIYVRDTPIDRTPLLFGAIAVAILEIAAAVTTLMQKPIGPRLFVIYGVAALLFVIVDGVMLWQLATLPTPESHSFANDFGHAAGSVIAFLFHAAWLVAAMAWPIAAMVIAGRWKPRPDHFGAPSITPRIELPMPAQPSSVGGDLVTSDA